MVFLHVLLNELVGAEGLRANGAFVRPHVEVHDHVAVEAAIGGEGRITHAAPEGFHTWRVRHRTASRPLGCRAHSRSPNVRVTVKGRAPGLTGVRVLVGLEHAR